jgi:hypothetical protein
MTDHDAELDAIVAMLEESGLVEEYDQADVKPRCGLVVLARSVGGWQRGERR